MKRKILRILLLLAMVFSLIPVIGKAGAKAFTYSFEDNPMGGDVAGPNKLDVRWSTNFGATWSQVCRDRSSDGLDDQQYMNLYNDNKDHAFLPYSKYPYYIKTYYKIKVNDKEYERYITSPRFRINQIGAFTKQPVGGEVAGPNTLDVSWELNFKPEYVTVWRDRSGEVDSEGNPMADQQYRNLYNDNMYGTALPWSKYQYYVVAYYKIDNVWYSLRSDNFTINQIGKYTVQPQGGGVAGPDYLDVSWELNYTPEYVTVWRDRSGEVNSEGEPVGDQQYKNLYNDNMYGTKLQWSKYQYYIMAYYKVDNVWYSNRSENFTIDQIGKFTVQPQGGEASGSETLDVLWKLNFKPEYVTVKRDRSKDGLENQNYRNLYNDNMYATSLSSSKYPYYVEAYYKIDNVWYSFVSDKFEVTQIGGFSDNVFIKEANGGEAAGADTVDVSWEFNFTPEYVTVWRDRSGDVDENGNTLPDLQYKNLYNDNMYSTKLPWSKYTYYIVGYYKVDNVWYSVKGDPFEIKQIAAFTIQPEGGEIAGEDNLDVSWEFNFKPEYVTVWRDRSADADEDGNTLSDQQYKNLYNDNMYKTSLPYSKYPYYIEAYYKIDNVWYTLRSDNFTIDQIAEFTVQPEGGEVAGEDSLAVSWEFNFKPEYVTVWRDRSTDVEADGNIQSDWQYKNLYTDNMYGASLPYSKYPYYIEAYYKIDNVWYTLRSESFVIDQIGAFKTQPSTVFIRKGSTYTTAWNINFKPEYVQICLDRSTGKGDDGNQLTDQVISNRYNDSMYNYTFKINNDFPYYIKANYIVDNVWYSIETERFFIYEAPAVQEIDLLNKETLYTGEELRPEIRVLDVNGDEIDPSEYTVSYSDNIEIGTAKILVTFTGNKYEGTLEGTFEIHVHEKEVTKKATPTQEGTEAIRCSICGHTEEFVIAAPANISLSQTTYTEDGTAKKPEVTVKDTDGNVISSDYYSINYTNNVKAGTAKVTITFKGDRYSGSTTKTFTIKPLTVISGKCGVNATYNLNLTTGLMTIAGSGDMEDYQYSSRTPWYKYRDKIKKVSIGANVTRIGTNAFYGCTNLTEVTGCANVKSIGINTFRNCPVLTKVAGCNKMTLVEQYAFCGSNKFATIGSTAGTVSLPACTKIGGYTFYECKGIKKLMTYSPMTYIGTRAFSNCTSMTSVQIGANCKTIGSYAFCGNTSLTTVTGCAGVTGLGDFAFYNNGKLVSVAGCTKVTNVGKSVFRNCTALTKVGATANQINLAAVNAVGEYAFSGCKAAKYISLGTGLTRIGQYAFQNTTALAKLYIRSSKLTSVGDHALKGIMATAVIYVPSAKLTAYKNGVLKGKGQGIKVTIKSITA